MRFCHPKATFFLICLTSFTQTAALAQTAPDTSACPVKADRFREMTDAQVKAMCSKTVNARAVAESFPNAYGTLFQCGRSIQMARESARVIYAVNERQKGFTPSIPETLNQSAAFDVAARNLLKLHNFTNISMAAVYRSRLKLRKMAGHGKDKEEVAAKDLAYAESRLKSEAREGDEPSLNPLAARGQRNVNGLKDIVDDLKMSNACLEQMKAPLDATFDDWKNLKADLLKNSFEKLVNEKPEPTPAPVKAEDVMANVANVTESNAATAKKLQGEQQYVYDMLTDPAKRDWAYRLAEGCQDHKCEDWGPVINAGNRITSYVTKTPVLGYCMQIFAVGMAGDLAMRQGLTFWQQVKEAANALVPFGLDIVSTEIKDIEQGKVNSYK